MSKPHRCHKCGHPGGWRRRVTNKKAACRCDCHVQPEKPKPPPPEPKAPKPVKPKPRNSVARKEKKRA